MSTDTLATARARALTDLEWRAMVELYDAKAGRVAELEARNAEHERRDQARIAQLEAALRPFAEIGQTFLAVDASDDSPWLDTPDSRTVDWSHLMLPVREYREACRVLAADKPRSLKELGATAAAVQKAAWSRTTETLAELAEAERFAVINEAPDAPDPAMLPTPKMTSGTVVQVSAGPDPLDLPTIDPP